MSVPFKLNPFGLRSNSACAPANSFIDQHTDHGQTSSSSVLADPQRRRVLGVTSLATVAAFNVSAVHALTQSASKTATATSIDVLFDLGFASGQWVAGQFNATTKHLNVAFGDCSNPAADGLREGFMAALGYSAQAQCTEFLSHQAGVMGFANVRSHETNQTISVDFDHALLSLIEFGSPSAKSPSVATLVQAGLIRLKLS
jgi:hypothetical protein